jgi:hypothetical protein
MAKTWRLNSFAFNYRSHETKIVHFVFMPNGPLAPASGLRGRRRTYYTILKLAEHAISKMVRYVLL